MLKTEKRRATKLNNKGMSLVEVIIAITILGIVAVAVLQSLTTAMVYNAKARTRQKLTLVAESIMETFKGYSLENLKYTFDDKDKAVLKSISGLYGGEYSYCSIPDGEEIKGSNGKDITISDYTGTFKFTVEDFTYDDSSEAKKYTANIYVIPNSDKPQNVYEVVDTSTTYNAVFVGNRDYDQDLKKNMRDVVFGDSSEVTNFYNALADDANANIDAQTSEDADEDFTYEYVTTMIQPSSSASKVELSNTSDECISQLGQLKTEDVSECIKINDRTTTYTITSDGKVSVKMEYHFTIENFKYTVTYKKNAKNNNGGNITQENQKSTEDIDYALSQYPLPSAGGTKNYLTYVVNLNLGTDDNPGLIYDNGKAPERLYAYYFPQYDYKDIIKIDKQSTNDLSCYFIKQVAQELSTPALQSKEAGYTPVISVSVNSGGKIYLYHNFNINLANSKKVRDFSTPSGFKASGDYTESSDFINEEQLSYKVIVQICDGDKVLSVLESSMNENVSSEVVSNGTEEESE